MQLPAMFLLTRRVKYYGHARGYLHIFFLSLIKKII